MANTSSSAGRRSSAGAGGRGTPTGGAARAARFRAGMRERGMRQITLWVPDVTAPGFAEEARRQSRNVAQGPDVEDDLAWLEEVGAFDDEEDGADAPR